VKLDFSILFLVRRKLCLKKFYEFYLRCLTINWNQHILYSFVSILNLVSLTIAWEFRPVKSNIWHRVNFSILIEVINNHSVPFNLSGLISKLLKNNALRWAILSSEVRDQKVDLSFLFEIHFFQNVNELSLDTQRQIFKRNYQEQRFGIILDLFEQIYVRSQLSELL
jgi:hypothetical protein